MSPVVVVLPSHNRGVGEEDDEEEDSNDVLVLVVVYSIYDSTSNVNSITNCVSVANRPIILSASLVLFVPLIFIR
jgi:hypothetical protein